MHSRLLFRRQFLISPSTCNTLDGWQHNTVGEHFIYAHPDLSLEIVSQPSGGSEIILLGDFVDPFDYEASNRSLLIKLAATTLSTEAVADFLYSLAGRFVLIIHRHGHFVVYHDPCGLRRVCYTRFEGKLLLASQPNLLKLAMPLADGKRFSDYQNSTFKKKSLEHWYPGGLTLYETVHQLVPNHYFDSATYEQVRYYPVRDLTSRSLEEGIEMSAELLRRIMEAASARFKLALPLTCGLDSRSILSASRQITDDLFVYTLQYRSMEPDSDDIRIARELCDDLGLTHHLIDCRKDMNPSFAEDYVQNSESSHLNDWGFIANGMYGQFPDNRIVIKGNCSEIAQRCIHHLYGWSPTLSTDEIIQKMGWDELPFIKAHVDQWYNKSVSAIPPGYKILDMFFWELNMGGWQAQSQLEWDIVQDAFTPFANRRLLDIMLGVDEIYRRKMYSNQELYYGMIEKLWPVLLTHPVNPSVVRR